MIWGRAGRLGGTERMLMELVYHSPDRAAGIARGAAVWERLARPREACAQWIRAARWRDDPEDPVWRKAYACARRDPGAGDAKAIRDYVISRARPERRDVLAAELEGRPPAVDGGTAARVDGGARRRRAVGHDRAARLSVRRRGARCCWRLPPLRLSLARRRGRPRARAPTAFASWRRRWRARGMRPAGRSPVPPARPGSRRGGWTGCRSGCTAARPARAGCSRAGRSTRCHGGNSSSSERRRSRAFHPRSAASWPARSPPRPRRPRPIRSCRWCTAARQARPARRHAHPPRADPARQLGAGRGACRGVRHGASRRRDRRRRRASRLRSGQPRPVGSGEGGVRARRVGTPARQLLLPPRLRRRRRATRAALAAGAAFVVAGVAALLVDGALHPARVLVGASGGVAALIGACIVLQPRAQVAIHLWPLALRLSMRGFFALTVASSAHGLAARARRRLDGPHRRARPRRRQRAGAAPSPERHSRVMSSEVLKTLSGPADITSGPSWEHQVAMLVPQGSVRAKGGTPLANEIVPRHGTPVALESIAHQRAVDLSDASEGDPLLRRSIARQGYAQQYEDEDRADVGDHEDRQIHTTRPGHGAFVMSSAVLKSLSGPAERISTSSPWHQYAMLVPHGSTRPRGCDVLSC